MILSSWLKLIIWKQLCFIWHEKQHKKKIHVYIGPSKYTANFNHSWSVMVESLISSWTVTPHTGSTWIFPVILVTWTCMRVVCYRPLVCMRTRRSTTTTAVTDWDRLVPGHYDDNAINYRECLSSNGYFARSRCVTEWMTLVARITMIEGLYRVSRPLLLTCRIERALSTCISRILTVNIINRIYETFCV